MIEPSNMEPLLMALIQESSLSRLFRPGRVKKKLDGQPRSVRIRLKLHNPYTFTEFELISKKSGLRFCVRHTRDMPQELRKTFRELGASNDNGNTRWEFACDAESVSPGGTVILAQLSALFGRLVSPAIIQSCGAERYKPLILLQRNQQGAQL